MRCKPFWNFKLFAQKCQIKFIVFQELLKYTDWHLKDIHVTMYKFGIWTLDWVFNQCQIISVSEGLFYVWLLMFFCDIRWNPKLLSSFYKIHAFYDNCLWMALSRLKTCFIKRPIYCTSAVKGLNIIFIKNEAKKKKN